MAYTAQIDHLDQCTSFWTLSCIDATLATAAVITPTAPEGCIKDSCFACPLSWSAQSLLPCQTDPVCALRHSTSFKAGSEEKCAKHKVAQSTGNVHCSCQHKPLANVRFFMLPMSISKFYRKSRYLWHKRHQLDLWGFTVIPWSRAGSDDRSQVQVITIRNKSLFCIMLHMVQCSPLNVLTFRCFILLGHFGHWPCCWNTCWCSSKKLLATAWCISFGIAAFWTCSKQPAFFKEVMSLIECFCERSTEEQFGDATQWTLALCSFLFTPDPINPAVNCCLKPPFTSCFFSWYSPSVASHEPSLFSTIKNSLSCCPQRGFSVVSALHCA